MAPTRVVHYWANQKRSRERRDGRRAEKAWLCFTEKGLMKFRLRSGDVGVS